MGYNITSWKTKQIKDFMVAISDIKSLKVFGEHMEIKEGENGGIIIKGGCNQTIYALPCQSENTIQITGFDNLRSDGSGHFYEDILKPLFKESTGHLEALIVWEGGDYICNLTVNDGEIEERKVE